MVTVYVMLYTLWYDRMSDDVSFHEDAFLVSENPSFLKYYFSREFKDIWNYFAKCCISTVGFILPMKIFVFYVNALSKSNFSIHISIDDNLREIIL